MQGSVNQNCSSTVKTKQTKFGRFRGIIRDEKLFHVIHFRIVLTEKDKNSTKSSFCSQTITQGQKSQK